MNIGFQMDCHFICLINKDVQSLKMNLLKITVDIWCDISKIVSVPWRIFLTKQGCEKKYSINIKKILGFNDIAKPLSKC